MHVLDLLVLSVLVRPSAAVAGYTGRGGPVTSRRSIPSRLLHPMDVLDLLFLHALVRPSITVPGYTGRGGPITSGRSACTPSLLLQIRAASRAIVSNVVAFCVSSCREAFGGIGRKTNAGGEILYFAGNYRIGEKDCRKSRLRLIPFESWSTHIFKTDVCTVSNMGL